MLPPTSETRSFLADADPDKRAKLIDRLLERPEFADAWALTWADLLRNEEKVLDAKGHAGVPRVDSRPVRRQRAAQRIRPRSAISGRGSTYANPPANYYRALRDPYARGEATAQVFLGVRVHAPVATIIRSIVGHRMTITNGPRFLVASNTASSTTSDRTALTPTNSPASKSCGWTVPAN